MAVKTLGIFGDQPAPPPVGPEPTESWMSAANASEYDLPPVTPAAPQLGTYQVQPAPTEPEMIGQFYRTLEGARAAAAAGPKEPTTATGRVAPLLQPGSAGAAEFIGGIGNALFNPLTGMYERPEEAPAWGMALSPLNLALPSAILEHGAARVGGGILGGTIGTEVASSLLPEDMDPLARMGLELAAGAAGGLAGERLAGVSSVARATPVPQQQWAAQTVPRAIEMIKKHEGYIDLRGVPYTDLELPTTPGTVFRMTGEQAQARGIGTRAQGPATFIVHDDGEIARLYDMPSPGVQNEMRKDPLNIARGRDALLSRLDMESRLGRIPEQTAAWGRAFVDALPESYLADLGSSFVKSIDPIEVRGAARGAMESVAGLYDDANIIVKLSKSVLEKSHDPARTIIHEVSHHLEQFVSPGDATALVKQYGRELRSKGRSALSNYQDSLGRVGEIIASANENAGGIEGQIARTLKERGYNDALAIASQGQLGGTPFGESLRQAMSQAAQDQRVAYRYTSFQEWFAENLADKFIASKKAAPDSRFARAVDAVKAFAHAFADATRKVFGREDIASSVYNDIIGGKYNPTERRALDPRLSLSVVNDELLEQRQPQFNRVPGDQPSKGVTGAMRAIFPAPIRATPPAPESGTRTGSLLRPRSFDQLGESPSVKSVLEVGNDLDRQVNSQVTTLSAAVDTNDRALGRTITGKDGNVYLRDVLDRNGNPALKQDVLENPQKYNLTPQQDVAVYNLQQVAQIAREEAQMFNVPELRETALQEGQNFVPRRVTYEGGPVVVGSNAPRKLSQIPEGERQFIDPKVAVENGWVYDDPAESLKSYVNLNLKNSATAHVTDLLKKLGTTEPEATYRNARVMSSVAPELQGVYFTPAEAKWIGRFFSGSMLPENSIGDVVRGINKVNKTVLPWQAIGDASATLKQLGTVLSSKPTLFMRNLGQSFVDSWGGWDNYQRWLASNEVKDAASHGVSLVGEGRNSDVWSSLASKIPGLKQTQRQFESVGNRTRVALYNTDLDMLRRTGQVVDEQAAEMVARNANRITGASNTRASDIENLAEFAPRFLRARFETIDKALRDGTLEGDLARQYISNYIWAGLAAVTASAIAQGRPLKDVLQPVEVSQNGKSVRVNPNFGTIRAGDTDIDVFSQYSGLVRMALTAGSGIYEGARAKDIGKVVSGLYNSVMAMESPSASVVDALVRAAHGTKAYGEDPRTAEFWLRKPLPIGLSQAISSAATGAEAKPLLTSGAAQFLGARAAPITPVEKAQQYGYDALRGREQFKALPSEAWRGIQQSAPDQFREPVSRYKSMYEWYGDLVQEYRAQAERDGFPKGIAQMLAEQAAAAHPVAKAYINYRKMLRNTWVSENPDIAREIIDEEADLPPSERSLRPSKKMGQFLAGQ